MCNFDEPGDSDGFSCRDACGDVMNGSMQDDKSDTRDGNDWESKTVTVQTVQSDSVFYNAVFRVVLVYT